MREKIAYLAMNPFHGIRNLNIKFYSDTILHFQKIIIFTKKYIYWVNRENFTF